MLLGIDPFDLGSHLQGEFHRCESEILHYVVEDTPCFNREFSAREDISYRLCDPMEMLSFTVASIFGRNLGFFSAIEGRIPFAFRYSECTTNVDWAGFCDDDHDLEMDLTDVVVHSH